MALSKIFEIKEKKLIESINSFKGLSHRHEIFLKKGNKTFYKRLKSH